MTDTNLFFLDQKLTKEALMKTTRIPASALLALAAALPAQAAEIPDNTLYFGGHASQYFTDISDRFDGDKPEDTTLPGLQLGYRLDPSWSIQAWWDRNQFHSEKGLVDGNMSTLLLSGRYHFHDTQLFDFEPYVGLAAGELNLDTGRDNKESMVGVEFGLQNRLRPHWMLDIGARPWYSLDNERWDGAAYIALNYLIGARDDNTADERTDSAPDSREVLRSTASNIVATVVGDADGDGINDALDQCPDTVAGTQVNAQGCERDSDADGVVDSQDQCADTPDGAKVDSVGCNLVLTEAIRETLYINFASGTANVEESSVAEVEKIVALMKQYPDTGVTLEGHTDSVGAASFNQQLSQQRADAVKAMLIERYGMDGTRISAVGKGEDVPVADNSTAAGRQQNRRVEVIVSSRD